MANTGSRSRRRRTNAKIQDMSEIRKWFDEGVSYKDMSRRYREIYGIEVSPSTFSNIRSRQGWARRNAAKSSDLFPWYVRLRHRNSYIHWMLRREQRRRQGLPQKSSQPIEKLDNWIQALYSVGAVVDYRPHTEQGFFLTPARAGIDTDLVRIPDEIYEVP